MFYPHFYLTFGTKIISGAILSGSKRNLTILYVLRNNMALAQVFSLAEYFVFGYCLKVATSANNSTQIV
jgi:hypothetical protein